MSIFEKACEQLSDNNQKIIEKVQEYYLELTSQYNFFSYEEASEVLKKMKDKFNFKDTKMISSEIIFKEDKNFKNINYNNLILRDKDTKVIFKIASNLQIDIIKDVQFKNTNGTNKRTFLNAIPFEINIRKTIKHNKTVPGPFLILRNSVPNLNNRDDSFLIKYSFLTGGLVPGSLPSILFKDYVHDRLNISNEDQEEHSAKFKELMNLFKNNSISDIKDIYDLKNDGLSMNFDIFLTTVESFVKSDKIDLSVKNKV